MRAVGRRHRLVLLDGAVGDVRAQARRCWCRRWSARRCSAAAAAETPNDDSDLLAGSFCFSRYAGIDDGGHQAEADDDRDDRRTSCSSGAPWPARPCASPRSSRRRSFSRSCCSWSCWPRVLSALCAVDGRQSDRRLYRRPPGRTGRVTRPRAPTGRAGRDLGAGRPLDLGATLGPMRRGSGRPDLPVRRARPGGGCGARPAPRRARRRCGSRSAPPTARSPATAWGAGRGLGARRAAGAARRRRRPEPASSPRAPGAARHLAGHGRAGGCRGPAGCWRRCVPAVLEQKVTGREAWRAWRSLVRRYGEPAPGPGGCRRTACASPRTPRPGAAGAVLGLAPRRRRPVPVPDPRHRRRPRRPARGAGRPAAGRGRDAALRTAAGHRRLDRGRGRPARPRRRRRRVGRRLPPGRRWSAGRWSASRSTTTRMLELLEPYRGHRYRAVRMIELSGLRAAAARPALRRARLPRDVTDTGVSLFPG